MPSFGLNVFSASSLPSGTDIVTVTGFSFPFIDSLTAENIIFLGTTFIAAIPTGCSSPFFVTLPTPSPPERYMLSSTKSVSALPLASLTSAHISVPLVTSGSSPLSLKTDAQTPYLSIRFIFTLSSVLMPFGVSINILSGIFPQKSTSAAAFAAAAAQVPVVTPHLNLFPFLRT